MFLNHVHHFRTSFNKQKPEWQHKKKKKHFQNQFRIFFFLIYNIINSILFGIIQRQ